MNTKLMQGQYRKILSNINKKYKLEFEEIYTKKSSYLFGIIETKLIWIYLFNGQIILEETNYLKGMRHKRHQGNEVKVITDEEIIEMELKVRDFIYGIKQNEKNEKIRNLFKKEKSELEQSFVSKMSDFLKMVYRIKEIQPLNWETLGKKMEIEYLFKETKYKTFEKIAPLLKGLEFHKNYTIKINENETKKISVIKNASNKVIYVDENINRIKVYESEKDFTENYLKDSSVVI
jgi:hypothetical protein